MAHNSRDNTLIDYESKLMDIVCKGMEELHNEYPGKILRSCAKVDYTTLNGVQLEVDLVNGFSRKYIIDLQIEWATAKKAITKQLQ